MSILDVFKKKYTAAQLEEQLAMFDAATVTMETRLLQIRQQLPNLAAREALGELEKDEAKALRGLRDEHLAIDRDLESRSAARAVIVHAQDAAAAEEARALRVAKIAEARAWQKKIEAVTGDLAAVMRTVNEKAAAVWRVEAEMPAFINQAKSSVAPVVGGWLSRFRFYVEPDLFDQAEGALEAQNRLLDQVLQEIEAGVPSRRERIAAGLPA